MFGFVNRYNGIILIILFTICIHVHFVYLSILNSMEMITKHIFLGLETTLIWHYLLWCSKLFKSQTKEKTVDGNCPNILLSRLKLFVSRVDYSGLISKILWKEYLDSYNDQLWRKWLRHCKWCSVLNIIGNHICQYSV